MAPARGAIRPPSWRRSRRIPSAAGDRPGAVPERSRQFRPAHPYGTRTHGCPLACKITKPGAGDGSRSARTGEVGPAVQRTGARSDHATEPGPADPARTPLPGLERRELNAAAHVTRADLAGAP